MSKPHQTSGVAGCCICLTTCLAISFIATLCTLFTSSGAGEIKGRWPSNGTGIEVTILNSLDSRWAPIFNEYLEVFGNGSPHALSLTSERRSHSRQCSMYSGLINVCNGNYGSVDWTGVASTWFEPSTGLIVGATVMLNDYYLDAASLNERKYTMCHELAHAFGLPHTDTKFLNLDKNNCLDYTKRYRNNLMPGQVNFDKLYYLYGSVTNETTTAAYKTTIQRLGVSSHREVPVSVMDESYAVIECLLNRTCSECIGQMDSEGKDRSVLHQSEQGETCNLQINGISIQTNKLLVH